MNEVDELIAMIDSKMSSGVSRLSVGFSEDLNTGVKREAYHHGRCDVGSPWAKGTVPNCEAVDGNNREAAKLSREEKLYQHIRRIAEKEALQETSHALPYMRERHKGQFRKPPKGSGEKIPYIMHPLMMACHAYALGVREDALLAAILLHDVVEDTGITLQELPFSDEVKHLVGLVTFSVPEGMEKEEAKKRYYREIRGDAKACVLKVIDRCNNVSTMAAAFTEERLLRYVKETEEYILPLCKVIREECPEYADLAFSVKYHILAVIETVKELTESRDAQH